MRCPRSVKKRMLLAEVAPISSTHIASSDLKLRASSAMALDRRFSRSCLFGSEDAAGVLLLRKNLIFMVWDAYPWAGDALALRARSTALGRPAEHADIAGPR